MRDIGFNNQINEENYDKIVEMRKGGLCEMMAFFYVFDNLDNEDFLRDHPHSKLILAILHKICISKLFEGGVTREEVMDSVPKIMGSIEDTLKASEENYGIDLSTLKPEDVDIVMIKKTDFNNQN